MLNDRRAILGPGGLRGTPAFGRCRRPHLRVAVLVRGMAPGSRADESRVDRHKSPCAQARGMTPATPQDDHTVPVRMARPVPHTPSARMARVIPPARAGGLVFHAHEAAINVPIGTSIGLLGVARADRAALLASGGRMPKRSQHRVSEGQDGRSERPARRHGQPRAAEKFASRIAERKCPLRVQPLSRVTEAAARRPRGASWRCGCRRCSRSLRSSRPRTRWPGAPRPLSRRRAPAGRGPAGRAW